jgi:hypothetical protein
MDLDIDDVSNVGEILNGLPNVNYDFILEQIGVIRGGMNGDHGSPIWCDKKEMLVNGPIKGLHQYVGHSHVPYVQKHLKLAGRTFKNTSVTYTDVLGIKEQFHHIEIHINNGDE